MKTRDFYYDLPPELIAQTPLERRDASRLLTLGRRTGEIAHTHFDALPDLLSPGDLLVMNDSQVLPARLLGQTDSGYGAEILLLHDRGDDIWECLVKPGKRCRVGARLNFGSGRLMGEVIEVLPCGNRLVRFSYEGLFLECLDKLGQMPLPPYIKEKLDDPRRYQTVYAREPGSAAAPTAGLHFTDALLERLRDKGINTAMVTLHVGLGTFRPVKSDTVEDHEMHSEYCILSRETAEKIAETRRSGGRIVAVGTTACRTLESFAEDDGTLEAGERWTDIFIYPGYRFKRVDGLITNFHLPESTLMMLISAFAGRDAVMAAYKAAVEEKYRFFSFGDAMLIL
ncbi:tRNA preQ1(34) S-adenosylmethionine ribosyltransferase-isomerase QueA [Oscillospiraceae bacterium OttesenSCG-928-F05]|nr:tRNA preQ1(34) S-adenosylmethionine ribosyltransferase-isomerase QueA [Oscillospiraceae bacterium OttesenSCG-928-F05]